MKYNTGNGPIRWHISTSMKVILEHFSFSLSLSLSLSHRFLDIRISKFVTCDLENVGQSHEVEHSQWRNLMINARPYLTAIIMFALSLIVYEIFTNQEKRQNV